MMLCVYYYVAHQPEDPWQRLLAAISFASVRKHIPGACIVHLTTKKSATAPLYGADMVMDVDASNRLFASVQIGKPALFLDTDTVIRSNVSDAFNASGFDVVAVEGLPHQTRPHNGGVVWARKPNQFFAEVIAQDGEPEDAFCAALKSHHFNVAFLPPIYNYIPANRKDRPEDAKIIHYKGNRKKWMVDEHLRIA